TITLPIAILYGPLPGLVTALLANAPLFKSLPALGLVIGLEAMLIGEAARRELSPLVAGLLAAALWGTAFAAWPTAIGAAPLPRLGLTLQGMLDASLALVIADLFGVMLRAGGDVDAIESVGIYRLRRYAFHIFVIVAVLPVLLLSAVAGQLYDVKPQYYLVT